MSKSVRAIISGRVQGVGYRAWTVATARDMGLSGWVRNCANGTVEAAFTGDSSAIEAMLTACREGPPAARPEGIETFTYNETANPTPPGAFAF